MSGSLTSRLADFAIAPVELPSDVRHAVRRALLDYLGVSVAGTGHPASAIAIAMVSHLDCGGSCAIIGSGHRTDAVNAALVNGVTAHVLDWDDTILPTRAHLSAALFPALLAMGEIEGWTLNRIAPAFATGFELQARINEAVYPSVHLRGWQGTGIAGGAGTAAAIGRLLGFDGATTAHAMGIAATNASGLIATFGSMSKALNIGRAGASGLQSALLAGRGFTSHPDIFGAGRFLQMYDDAPRPEVLTEGLGERWRILENGYKPYPCGFVAHAMIDAVRDLRRQVGPQTGLRRLELTVSPESTHLMGNLDPRNELEAKFSLLYDAAVAWVDGHVTPAAFEESAIADPRYRAIMAVTHIESSPSVRQHEAHAAAELDDGSRLTADVHNARGTPARPLTDSDLVEKFVAALAIGGIASGEDLAGLVLADDDVQISALVDQINRRFARADRPTIGAH